MSTTATAGTPVAMLRSSPAQMPANDSTNLQNELSLASVVAFPAPSINLPSVHTLVNSAALPITATTHSAAGSSMPQNPSNAQGSKAPTTTAPSSPIQVSPSSKSTSTGATTADSTTDHSQPTGAPAIQLASQQPAPTPSTPNTSVATTTVLPNSNADPAVLSQPQPPSPAPPTANAANAAAELPPATPLSPGPVQMAQMVTRASQSEMRIGLNTSAFGSVEVRTVVHAGDVGLSVGSEKGDLHSLLSNELPTIANSLQQQSLRLTQVSFHQGSGLSGNLSSGGGSSQQQRFTSPTPSSAGWNIDERAEISTETDDSYSLSGGAGLSILA